MKPARIRTQLRLGQDAVARLAGVSRATIRIYEAHPDAVGARHADVRARCDWVYAELAWLSRRMHAMRATRLGAVLPKIRAKLEEIDALLNEVMP